MRRVVSFLLVSLALAADDILLTPATVTSVPAHRPTVTTNAVVASNTTVSRPEVAARFLIACVAGQYASAAASACSSCAVGTYSAAVASSCSSCPVGTYSAAAASSCSSCAAGKYSTAAGSTACSICPLGTFSAVSGANVCKSCYSGTYAAASGSSKCTNCATGLCSKGGASSCFTQCAAGQYLPPSGPCTVCPFGTYSDGCARACSPCPSGQYYVYPAKCVNCAAGYYSVTGTGTNAVGASECTECADGYHSTLGSSACTIAPRPFYGYKCTTGPKFWAVNYNKMCNNTAQSPINIDALNRGYSLTTSLNTPVVNYIFPTIADFNVSQVNGAPLYSCRKNCSTVLFKGVTYTMQSMSFHVPAEHTVNGIHYAIEGQMLHTETKNGKISTIVFSVFFDALASESVPDVNLNATDTISKLWTYIKSPRPNPSTNSEVLGVDLGRLLSLDSGFYQYSGSLTTPPCTPATWLLQATPVSIKQSHVDLMFAQVGGYPGNARPVQPLFGRRVKYYVDSTTFSYDGLMGPAYWRDLTFAYRGCGSMGQSPINIDALDDGYTLVTSQYTSVEKFISTAASITLKVSQLHSSPVFSCFTPGDCGTFSFYGTVFNLVSVKFHSPSEHTINGVRYAMAGDFFFQDPRSRSNLIFEVLFFSGVPETSTTSAAATTLSKLWTMMYSATGSVSGINLGDFVVAGSGFYSYTGSYTTPPCTAGVTWVIQATPVAIMQSQIDKLYSRVGGAPGNARPLQPLSGRKIYYFIDQPGWTYTGVTGPNYWASLGYSTCGSTSQSPINIDPRANGYKFQTTGENRIKFMMKPKPGIAYTISQVRGVPVFSCPNPGECGEIMFNTATFTYGEGRKTYTLISSTLKAPAEHIINGVRYPMSVQIKYQSNKTGELVMVEFPCDATLQENIVRPFTRVQGRKQFNKQKKFENKMRKNKARRENHKHKHERRLLRRLTSGSKVVARMLSFMSPFYGPGFATTGINLGHLEVPKSGYYAYSGSLTTPPCTEGVTWIIQAYPIALQQSMIDLFTANITTYPGNIRGNARPIQALNGRTVYFRMDTEFVHNWKKKYRLATFFFVSVLLVFLCIFIKVIGIPALIRAFKDFMAKRAERAAEAAAAAAAEAELAASEPAMDDDDGDDDGPTNKKKKAKTKKGKKAKGASEVEMKSVKSSSKYKS